ncbi:MAG: hypothetical protein AAFU53_08065, partial [Cyanobacteria bacterium J06632_3]
MNVPTLGIFHADKMMHRNSLQNAKSDASKSQWSQALCSFYDMPLSPELSAHLRSFSCFYVLNKTS